MSTPIALQKPCLTGAEIENISRALEACDLAGNDQFTQQCRAWLEARIGGRALLTQSGSAALDICAMAADLAPGDEVVMPSFTFPSTANAVALRGATPVFVDIREDTLNIDEMRIEAAITDKTRAIFVVHYAGVACEMEAIGEIARARGLLVIEDAAQAIGASYRGRPLGAWGDMAAFSFHATKNVVAGQGGAFVTHNEALYRRAEMHLEKGTDRSAFLRGEVQKYCWRTLGGGYLPSELTTALLAAQLAAVDVQTRRRLALWRGYYESLEDLEVAGALRRPRMPLGAAHNAHLFYILLPDSGVRDHVLDGLRAANISAAFHYVPLHSSPAGQRYGRAVGELAHTDDLSARLLRLPLHAGLTDEEQARVLTALDDLLGAARAPRIVSGQY